ncbi:MAG: FtsX-like permease family protein [Planctomycetota bacterium]
MYGWLLISTYLRRKLAPLFAALAVTLCTFMVVTVISVMSGFIEELRRSAKKLTGDLIVTGLGGPLTDYEALSGRLVALPDIDAATPVVRGFGLLQIGDFAKPVALVGVRPGELDRVMPYVETLLWDGTETPRRGGTFPPGLLRQAGSTLTLPDAPGDDDPWGWLVEQGAEPPPAVVIGVEVNPRHTRDEAGRYDPANALSGWGVSLIVAPPDLTQLGERKPARRRVVVVNEFKSGLYQVDEQTVFVPFDWLQSAVEMQEKNFFPEYDELGRPLGDPVVRPAGASELLLKTAPGVDLSAAQRAVEVVCAAYAAEAGVFTPRVTTWEQQHGRFLSAVENERFLIVMLFVIVSGTAVVMVASTFYMIVLEKTRDIGLLRAIGASRRSVTGMFLGYGLAIGVIGAGLGVTGAVVLVTQLNPVQDWIAATFGWRMWDPRTYFFDEIPARINAVETGAIAAGAVVSSVLGAVIPAVFAARVDPIRSLRYE